MKNIFLVGMLVGLGFVFFGLQQAGHPSAPNPASDPHQHTAAPPRPVDVNSSQSAATAAASVVFDTSHPGYQVYTAKGCQRCHGSDLLGTRMAPALVDARQNFDRQSLGEYLADPAAYIQKDPRLKALDQRYRMQEMPAVQLSESELRQLAGLILGRES